MLGQHLVRFGAMGVVERFVSVDGAAYPRGTRVICRTQRGLEAAEVLASPAETAAAGRHAAVAANHALPGGRGQILRRMGVEDELLLARLDRRRDEAFTRCAALLAERRLDAVLVDVEQLFDGETLLFYFLGEPSPELDSLTAELRETYSSAVEFRQFAETLAQGCGPGCGTEEAAGQGCGEGGCSTCAVIAACGAKSR